MNLKYQNRWFYVLSICFKMSKIIESGGIIYDEYNDTVEEIVYTNNGIYFKCGENGRVLIIEKDFDFDHGIYTSIRHWKKFFKGYRYIEVKDIKYLTQN